MSQPRTTTLAHRSRLAGFNDVQGLLQALLSGASLTPTGTPDTARSSQYLQALGALFPRGQLGTADGNIPQIGTPGTTSLGTRSAVVVRSGSNANGSFRVWSDGFKEAFIIFTSLRNQVITTPINFDNTNYSISCIHVDAGAVNAPSIGNTTN